MQQTSFNFGPTHNLRDPNTSTASSSNIDDLVSKLGSLLFGSTSNKEQLERTLKSAVKEGIIEASKEDVRVSDAEERDAERRHKELMYHLSRIASLGGNNKVGLSPNEKEKDGFGILDALKWGGVAAGVLGLVTNFGDLIKIFDDTTKKVGDFKDKVVGMAGDVENLIPKLATAATSVGEVSNEILGMIGNVKDFGKTMGDLVDKAFTPEGAVGALLAAFIPGGAIAKAIFALFGATAAGNVFNQGSGNSTTPVSSNTGLPNTTGRLPQTQAEMLMSQTYGMDNSQADMLAKQNEGMDFGSAPGSQTLAGGTVIPSIRNAGVNPTAVAAGVGGFAIGGGGPLARTFRGGVAYLLGDAVAPGLDENGNPKPSLLSRSKDDIMSIYEANRLYNDDGTRKKETWEGLGAAATVAAATVRSAPKNKWTLGAAVVGGVAAYDWANDDVSILGDIKNPSLHGASVALGITRPDNPYSRKLQEYDEQIAKLSKELNSAGDPKLSFKENDIRMTKLGERIQQLKEKKSQFNTAVNENNTNFIKERLNAIPEDPTAGGRPLISGNDLPWIGAGTAWGAIVGTTTGAVSTGPFAPLGALGGSVLGGIGGAATSTAMTAGFNGAMNAFETYVEEKYKRKIDAIQLASQDPKTLWDILVQYSSENPVTSKIIFGGIAAGMLGVKGASKILIELAKKRLGIAVVGTATATTSTMVTQAGIKTGVAAGFGASVANSLGNQQTILGGDITSVLSTPNTNIQTNNPTIAPLNPQNYYTLNIDPLASPNTVSSNRPSVEEMLAKQMEGMDDLQTTQPSIIERLAMGNNDDPIPSGIPTNPSGTNLPTISSMSNNELWNKVRSDHNTFKENKYVDDGLTEIITTKSGKKFEVAKSHAKQFKGFIEELEATGYKINSIHGLDNRFGSKNPLSMHNMGTAIDINPSSNPQLPKRGDKIVTDMNQDVVRKLAEKYGLEWGGDYGKPDAMHFALKKSLRTAEDDPKNIRNTIFGKRALGITGDSSSFGPMGNLIAQILRTESNGGDPDAFYGSGQHSDLLQGKKLSSMTFNELKTFQKEITKRQGTSPVGIGQWIGTTLFGKGYNDTGFLKEHFGNADYGSKVFDLDTQKDMFKSFLKSKKYGNLEGFINNPNMSIDSYAAHLGGQWQGVQKPEEQAKLKATLAELRKTPDLNIDQALNKVMASMSNLSEKTGDFKKMFNGVADQITDAFSSIKDFLSDVTNKAGELLPQEFKDLFNLPEMKEFLDPFLGGESKSTLAHPKKTFTSLESQELRTLLLGTPEATETTPTDDKVSIVPSPNISGEQLAASSSALKSAEQRASQQNLGSIINMSTGNGGETIHGQQIAGLSGNINTHFPGDIDAISARIYQWTDAPMFYAAGKIT